MREINQVVTTSIIILLLIPIFSVIVLAEEPINFSSMNLTNRTMYSDVYYDTIEKHYVTKITSSPINYHDGEQYVPINTDVTEVNKDGYKYGVETGVYDAYFKEKSEKTATEWLKPIKVVKDGYALILEPDNLFFTNERNENKNNSNISISNSTVAYANQFENIDLEFTYTNSKLKEELVISELSDLYDLKASPTSTDELILIFNVRGFNISSNESLDMEINNETVSYINLSETNTTIPIYFLNESNKTIFSLSSPIAYDSNNDLIKLRYAISSDSVGNLVISIYTPYSWLETATYPVYIDPTVNIDIDYWGQVEYDCEYDEWYFDDEDLTAIGARASGYLTRGWMEFDVDWIDDAAEITDVDLWYYVNGVDEDDCSDVDLRFYELDEEDYDDTPDDDAEMQDIWEAIGEDDYYGEDIFNSGDDDYWENEDLGSDGNNEVESLIDGTPTDWFMIGLKVQDSDEVCMDDCHVDLEDTEGDSELPYIVVTYTLPCYSNADCPANQYCGIDQVCYNDKVNSQMCNGITYVHSNSQEDGACTSGYCDSDDVGLADDNWCFTPYNTRFDGQEPTKCEYSTNYGSSATDERSVGTDLNTCNQAGHPYFEDEVSSGCGQTDITFRFECTESGCWCGDSQCDGISPQGTINFCDKGGQTYFQDDCGSAATAEDHDNICRSSGSLGGGDGCTAHPVCNGVEAGTAFCDGSCAVTGNLTQNVSFYVNGTEVWNHSGYFTTTETTDDFFQQLNDALATCTADEEGYCTIPLTIHSDSAGKINISNIDIYFNITEYIWDTLGLAELSTYRVRVKSTDGYLNSSWDTSDSDFTIGTADNLPVVTLVSPSNDSVDTDGTVVFNCSATDDNNLVNITLYGNWGGAWHANETKSLSGTSDYATFTKSLPNGIYTWNCLAHDNASQNDWGNNNWTINVSVISTASIELDLIHPTTNVNVTSNKFFNVTVNVTCRGDDCGEINVSLDPAPKTPHTRSSDTVCTGNICTTTLYSGIRNVYEDGVWKRVEDARSLKDKGFTIKYLDTDENYQLKIIDFNYDSVTFDLTIKNSEINKNIPMRTWKINDTKLANDTLVKKSYKDYFDMKKGENIKQASQKETYNREIGLDKILEIGGASTTITLQEADTENMKDAKVDDYHPDSNSGSVPLEVIGYLASAVRRDYITFNISDLSYLNPEGIIEAKLSLYKINTTISAYDESTFNNAVFIHQVYDSWKNISDSSDELGEYEITWNNQPCGLGYNGNYNSTNCNSTYEDYIVIPVNFTSSYMWHNWSVKNMLSEELNNGDKNITFLLRGNESISAPSGLLRFYSKEASSSSLRPLLTVIYTVPPKGLIPTSIGATPFYTNDSNPRNISLNQDESQLVVFWVNATGNVNDTYEFFAFANKTSDPSISNITSKWNVTIRAAVDIDLVVDNLSVIYGNSSERIFKFDILNSLDYALDDINWTLDTGETNITSQYNVSLQPDESIFVYVAYNYTVGGEYTVTATAESDGILDSDSIEINVTI